MYSVHVYSNDDQRKFYQNCKFHKPRDRGTCAWALPYKSCEMLYLLLFQYTSISIVLRYYNAAFLPHCWFLCPRDRRSGGILFLSCLSFCPPLWIFNLANNFWTASSRALTFHMNIPCDKILPWVPLFLYPAKFAGVYSDPYVCPFDRPSVPISNLLLLLDRWTEFHETFRNCSLHDAILHLLF